MNLAFVYRPRPVCPQLIDDFPSWAVIPVVYTVASPAQMLPGSWLLSNGVQVYLATARGETRVLLVNDDEALSVEMLAGVPTVGHQSE